eukprot:CAMPEP_0168624912 /NCGR_PEP_ID=MMETSP0449_2-20121227/9694_1 /TAXON_ID=1082188 /ORGANISM="Strombidium rassoulzadegani, Strain ras09" /LENGTH=31 /DNA_ID= /DNA_START= /DNA_END= /DNA_ORIENTATION=
MGGLSQQAVVAKAYADVAGSDAADFLYDNRI